MEKTECQKLAERFASMAKNDGLLDVKFYVAGEVASEQACREVNRLYEALGNSESTELDFKDSYRQ
jgi:hypothetical protein